MTNYFPSHVILFPHDFPFIFLWMGFYVCLYSYTDSCSVLIASQLTTCNLLYFVFQLLHKHLKHCDHFALYTVALYWEKHSFTLYVKQRRFKILHGNNDIWKCWRFAILYTLKKTFISINSDLLSVTYYLWPIISEIWIIISEVWVTNHDYS